MFEEISELMVQIILVSKQYIDVFQDFWQLLT